MPGIISDIRKFVAWLLLLCAVASMVSCASDKQQALVNDPNDRPESTIPWNRQEKWEVGSGIPSVLGESR